MYKFYKQEREVTKIKLHIPNETSTEDYAKRFLHIWNNAREYPNMILKVENNRGNDIYIICEKKAEENVIDYLEYFGEIIHKEKARMITIKANYDEFGYDEFFKDEEETYFEVNID